MPDEPTKKKDELLRLLSNVEPQAQRLEELGKEISRSARLSMDVAGSIRYVVSRIPAESLSLEHWDHQLESWHAWCGAAGDLETARTNINTFNALSSAVTNTSSAMIVSVSVPASPQIQADVERAKLQLHQTLGRLPLVDDARASMQRLGLDARRGSQRAPLQILDEAFGAIERAGGPVSVLIALRECINSVISELLRRRPTQEHTAKTLDKLTSLGRQCARAGLKVDHFERLAVDADILLNDLSRAKQAEMSREQQDQFFHRGLLFLNTLMSSIDETSLRSP